MQKIQTKTSLLDKLEDFLQSHTTKTYICQIDDFDPFIKKEIYNNYSENLLYGAIYTLK